MRKGVSLLFLAASDVACIAGGIIAGVVAIQLLQTASYSNPTSWWLKTAEPSFADPGVRVNRARKTDREDVIPFDHRFPETSGAAPPNSTPDGPSSRVPSWTDPGSSTTVPKGAVRSTDPQQSPVNPAQKPQGASKPQPVPNRVIACEPLASPLADPSLTRFPGRCLTQSRPPAGNIRS